MLFTPLVEQALVRQRFLQHHAVDFDVSLVEPVLVFAVANSGHELIHVEAGACRLLLLRVDLVLLVGRV